MSILSSSDFTGVWDLSLISYETADIDLIVSEVEDQILRQLLGDDLNKQFQTAIAGSPAQKYVDLRDGVYYKIVDDAQSDATTDIVEKKFDGLTKMLKYFTWYEVVRTNQSKPSPTGQIYQVGENSERVPNGDLGHVLTRQYNEGVKIYKEAYLFIYEQNDWTKIESTSGLTMLTNRTKYLANADSVEIGSDDLTASSVVSDTSFVVDSAPSSSASWRKIFFTNWKYTEKNFLMLGGV